MRSVRLQNGVSAQDAWSDADQQERLRLSKLALSHGAPLPLLRSQDFYRLLILVVLFGICTLFYYFGELVDFAGWTALRWQFFYDVHDIHRLLSFAPIIYACYFFGVKAMVTVTAASLLVFLPRAIFISPFPDAILRSLLFAVAPGFLYYYIRMTHHKLQGCGGVKTVVRNEKNDFIGVPKRTEDGVFVVADLEVDLPRRLVKRRGQIVKLTPKEYELLACLVSSSGKVLTNEELLHNVWGPQYGQENEYVRNFIRQLRHKIEDDPSNPQFIVTGPHFGYRFLGPEGIPN